MSVQTSYGSGMPVAFAGMKADSGEDDCRSFSQAEASAEVPFGVAVAQGASGSKAILPADANSKIVGVVVHSHDYVPGIQLGDTGIKPKNMMSVMAQGRIWVLVEEAVAVNDPVFVRHTANGAGKLQKGAFRNDIDTDKCISVPGARFITASSGAGIVQIEIDIPANFAAANVLATALAAD